MTEQKRKQTHEKKGRKHKNKQSKKRREPHSHMM